MENLEFFFNSPILYMKSKHFHVDKKTYNNPDDNLYSGIKTL